MARFPEIGSGSIREAAEKPAHALAASGPSFGLSLPIKRIHGLPIAAQREPLEGATFAGAGRLRGLFSLLVAFSLFTTSSRRNRTCRRLGAAAVRAYVLRMLLMIDPAVFEGAWEKALPGREAAERNALLRALVAALERPPQPCPVLHRRR